MDADYWLFDSKPLICKQLIIKIYHSNENCFMKFTHLFPTEYFYFIEIFKRYFTFI